MRALLESRLIRTYALFCLGLLLLLLRRFFMPNFFELSGLPPEIATASALSACPTTPAITICGDTAIFLFTTLGMFIAFGWGNLKVALFSLLVAPLPFALYFLLAPLWSVLLVLALIPAVLELGLRFVFPTP